MAKICPCSTCLQPILSRYYGYPKPKIWVPILPQLTCTWFGPMFLLFSRCSSWLFWRRINIRYYILHYPKKKDFVLDIAASSVFVLLGIGDMKDISDSLEALNKSQSKQGEGFGGFWVFWCSWGFLQKLPNNFGTDSLCMHSAELKAGKKCNLGKLHHERLKSKVIGIFFSNR